MNRLKKVFLGVLLGCFAVCAYAEDNVVTATYGNATGNTTRTMTVALNHETDYVAFALQLTLPEGTTVAGVTAKSPLMSNETIDLSAKGGSATESKSFKVPFKQNGTKCNIVGYNYANMAIGGESGDILLTVTLQTAAGVAYNADAITTACTFVDESSTEANLGSPVTEARLWGDVVKDRKLDAKDKQTLTNILLEKPYDSNTDLFAGDMNQDDKYDAKDKQTLSNKILGK